MCVYLCIFLPCFAMHQAIEQECKTASGYSGIRDVTKASSPKDNKMQSFFLAETLKYLYLLFTDSTVIPLDQYVFNTEAHPLSLFTKKPGKYDVDQLPWY